MGYAAKDDMKGCETQRRRFLLSLKFSTRGTAICIVIPKWNLAAVGGGRKVELLSKFGHCRAQRRPVDKGWRIGQDRGG